MSTGPSPVRFRVRGEYACFTRPEMKTERVSYEVITPSAARGVLEAIMWKPAIRWRIERIHVLAPIRLTSIRRNEVKSRLSATGNVDRYFASEDRSQRNALVLRDVDYIVEARFEMTDRAGPDDNPGKFRDMIERRLAAGACYHRPYLGCREFAADVERAPAEWAVDASLQGERDLGLMLHDLEFGMDGTATPRFFHAVMKDGVIDVPRGAL